LFVAFVAFDPILLLLHSWMVPVFYDFIWKTYWRHEQFCFNHYHWYLRVLSWFKFEKKLKQW
jgi:hypothetical protein